MHRNGGSIDPLSLDTDMPAGDPIPPDAQERWLADLGVRMAVLQRLPGGPVVRIAQVETDRLQASAPDRQ